MMSKVNRAEPDLKVLMVSDASGSWGCGALHGQDWFQLKWEGLGESIQQNITIKELPSIVIAAAMRGKRWTGSTVRAQCDNTAVVEIVNSGSSQEPEAMYLRRCLAFLEAQFQFYIWATHIRGCDNLLADALSRNKTSLFHSLSPGEQGSCANTSVVARHPSGVEARLDVEE